jgi:hypothetical protein
MSEVTIEQFNELKAKLASFETEHNAFKSVHVSRRGVEGAPGRVGERGPSGPPGSTGSQGTPGRNGLDANISDCVAAAQAAISQELAEFRASLGSAIVSELKAAGVVDAQGAAILIPGHDGKDGKDSVVPGERGIPGASIVGPNGHNGRDAQVAIGHISVGDLAAASVRAVNGVSYIDLVLPRAEKGDSGPAGAVGAAGQNGIDGKNGTPGPRGGAGDISAAVANAVAAVESRFAELRAEVLAMVDASIASRQ